MIDLIKTIVQSVLALFVVIPTVIVLVILATNGNEWAACTLVGMAVAVLAYYGYKVKQEADNKAAREAGLIPYQDIVKAYKKAFNISSIDVLKKKVCFHIEDVNYEPIDWTEFEKFIREDKTDKKDYCDKFDCENFGYVMLGAIRSNDKLTACPIFGAKILIDGAHYLLTFYQDGKVKFLEPQTDEVINVHPEWRLAYING